MDMEMTSSASGDIHQTRAEFVADRIERAILRGELAAGQHIVESVLAEQLHVSKTPIREALRVLARKGVVTTNSYKGTVVRDIDKSAARYLFEVRLLNEPEAVARAIPFHNEVSLATCQEALLAARNAGTGDSGLADRSIANRRFHRSLYAPCENDHLRRILDEIQDQVAMITVSTWRRRSTWVEEESEHAAILLAVKGGDRETARGLMSEHISGFFSRLDS
jgi:DNA-binding GntR family transcriptional regulator